MRFHKELQLVLASTFGAVMVLVQGLPSAGQSELITEGTSQAGQSQWIMPGPSQAGQSQWIMPGPSQAGQSQWIMPGSNQTGQSQWVMPGSNQTGQSQWIMPGPSQTGQSQWVMPGSNQTGQSQWVMPGSNQTGQSQLIQQPVSAITTPRQPKPIQQNMFGQSRPTYSADNMNTPALSGQVKEMDLCSNPVTFGQSNPLTEGLNGQPSALSLGVTLLPAVLDLIQTFQQARPAGGFRLPTFNQRYAP